MAKRVSTRKIKKHRLYSYGEAGGALGVSPHTVRTWRPLGLVVMDANTPHYILGAELIRFIEEKQAKRSVKMAKDQMYCLKCKAPRKPLWAMVDYIPISDTRGRLTGLCEACDRCTTVEEFKAWGMNIGHENMAVTMGSYLPIAKQRKEELINGLK